MTTPLSFFCSSCDETYSPADVIRGSSGPLCSVCGQVLASVTNTSLAASNTPSIASPGIGQSSTQQSLLADFEAFLNPEARELFLGLLHGDPLRGQALSPAVADKLGVLIVDPVTSILRDVTLHVGPLILSCIPATFSPVPDTSEDISLFATSLRTVTDDEWAESAVSGVPPTTFLVVKRGRVSFARKTINCEGCSALFVTQPTEYMWPFQATDTAGELRAASNAPHSQFPVLTVRERDMAVAMQYLSKAVEPPSIRLCFGSASKDCSICQEAFAVGDQVLKLPCRHLFHSDCVRCWLEAKTTCPLCRNRLPDASEEEASRRIDRLRDAEHSMYA